MNSFDIARMDRSTLQSTYNDLVVQKMHIDKWFSDFLEENTLDHDNLDDPNWKIYKTKMEEYRGMTSLINSVEYQLRKI